MLFTYCRGSARYCWGLYPYCCKSVHSLTRTLYLFKVWRINRVVRNYYSTS